MGFKRVSIKELETKLSPNFLGMPLKQVEAIIEHEKTEEKIQVSDLEIKNINLFNEDILEYSYDNRGDLKNFHGDGFISVLNHSKKDRIWDTRVKVSSVKNTNLNGDDVIIFGNLEPETNKKINYNIINPENLVNPMKITESINVLNFETERGENKLKEKSATDKVADKIVDSQIKDIGAKLASEKEKFEEANAKVAEWTIKVENLNTTIKKLKDTQDSYLKTKSIYRDMKLKKFTEIKKKKDISDYESSIKEIKNQIQQEQDEIIKINEDYSKKEKTAKKEIKEEFDPKIKSVKSQFKAEEENLDKIIKNINQYSTNKKDLEEQVKILKKEFNSLKKAKAIIKADKIKIEDINKEDPSKKKNIEKKLASEQNKLEEAIKNVDEWSTKKKESEKLLKKLQEEFDSLNNSKSKLDAEQENLDKIIKNFNQYNSSKKDLGESIKSIKKELNYLKKSKAKAIKKADETKTEEINKEHDSKIKNSEEKLASEQTKLEEVSKNVNEWSIKKKESEKLLNNLQKEFDSLIKLKSKLDAEQENLDKIIKNFDHWTIIKIDLEEQIKSTKKEPKSLSKIKVKAINKADETKTEKINKEHDSKIKNSEEKLASEQKKLEEAIKNIDECNTKKKESEKLLNYLQKKIDSLNKAKSKILNDRSKTLSRERNIQIKESDKKIKSKEQELSRIQNLSTKQSSSLQEIEDEYDPKIKEINSKINIEQPKLAEAKKNLKKWTNKKNELDNYIENVEKEYEALVQADPEARSIRLKRMLGEDGLDRIHTFSGINTSELSKNHLLLFNKNNPIQISIILENDTNFSVENILLGKHFSEDFSNFKCKSSAISEVNIEKGNIIWKISEMKPGEIVELEITADIFPKEKKIIGTGDIQISYDYKNYLISGINVENFSAYSHAMHAIRIKEKENEPYKWDCALYFKNNCELNMELRSILVLDEEKQKKYIDFNGENEKIIISPGDSYSTENWEIYSEEEPKFYRKLDYSITHSINKKSSIFLKIEENVFDIVDAHISKKFSLAEIKSFEKAKIENHINIKNTGSIDIEAIAIEDVVPADFSPPLKISEIKVRNSSGNINLDDIKLKIIPEDDDPSKNHLIFLKINGDNSEHLININDFLEIKYSFNAVRPDYKVKYEFPLKVISYYSKFQEKTDDYFKITSELNSADLPQLKIIHKRRNLIIGKSIFPGRDVNEFGISIIINNKSNVEINDIKITDTISKSFELISSNLEAEILESGDRDRNIISFTIESIFPYQEKEIRYYLRNVSGEDIGYEELESYIFG